MTQNSYLSKLRSLLQSWRSYAFHRQKKLEVHLAEVSKKPRPSWHDAHVYANRVMVSVLSRLEFFYALAVVFLLCYGTQIFLPFGSVEPGTRIGIVLSGTVLGAATALGLTYGFLNLRMRYDLNLTMTVALHIIASTLIFSAVEPLIVWKVFGYRGVSFSHMLSPMFLIYAVIDIFLVWQLKMIISFREFRESHQSEGLETLIPPEKRGDILLMSAADHYVEFFTENGSHMQRMTMKAAIEKAGAGSGLRVHRSHWVAFRAMHALEKEGERYFLTLRSGQRVPVSNKAAQEVRQAIASAA